MREYELPPMLFTVSGNVRFYLHATTLGMREGSFPGDAGALRAAQKDAVRGLRLGSTFRVWIVGHDRALSAKLTASCGATVRATVCFYRRCVVLRKIQLA
jgi:hypothetical protein